LARDHVEKSKERPGKSQIRPSSSIPEKVLNDCESSYKAAQEKVGNIDESAYDTKGIMVMVCSHDVPLFLVDVETFGEPRYLAVALLRKLNGMIPDSATVGVMYDIGDQLDRTIEKVNISYFLIIIMRT